MDNSVFPPHIKKLYYEFDGWLGDDILESFPCYIVTESLRKDFENNKFTGISFHEATISKSETFSELYPERELPDFHWLQINGEVYKDDFFTTEEKYVSDLGKCLFCIAKT